MICAAIIRRTNQMPHSESTSAEVFSFIMPGQTGSPSCPVTAKAQNAPLVYLFMYNFELYRITPEEIYK